VACVRRFFFSPAAKGRLQPQSQPEGEERTRKEQMVKKKGVHSTQKPQRNRRRRRRAAQRPSPLGEPPSCSPPLMKKQHDKANGMRVLKVLADRFLNSSHPLIELQCRSQARLGDCWPGDEGAGPDWSPMCRL
jgi:hypothetical protein